MKQKFIIILSAFIFIVSYSCGIFKEVKREEPVKELPIEEKEIQEPTEETTRVELKIPEQVSDKEKEEVIKELSFEVKKLTAKVSSLANDLNELKARAQIWQNPFSFYDKEIILTNGTSIFGKIIYQDDEIIKVETLIGYLVVKRDEIVRIVSNTVAQATEYVIPEEVEKRMESQAPTTQTQTVLIPKTQTKVSAIGTGQANCVLMGSVKERKTSTGNLVLYGEVKNIGTRRADFVKINFVFRRDWSGTKDIKTVFVEGSSYTFKKTGITTSNSLQPGETGKFELILPKNFGTFVSYSYNIEWEYFD